MAVENISQKSYSYRFLTGAIMLGILTGFSLYSYATVDESAILSFVGSFISGILILAFGIPTIICTIRFVKFYNMPSDEWNEFARTRRAFLSIAVYRHPLTGDERTVRRGFSIPVFLFGFFAPLCKGQWELALKFFIIVWLAQLVSSIIPAIGNILAYVFTNFGLARRYNKYYEDWLIKQGYQLADTERFTENIKSIQSDIKRLN